ncbi:hypothetical protein F3Y22_tig00111105pilonHSYRG00804 [Hibiscus syriacus]|uniref:Myb-like domain-containing protein n=1 Tax=Hibiscus syriacus TaxID=106335 RepID=A0A6A2YZQ2_HIBSY|nr:trihelix transcription factor PTL-like [Hibiscus syriacus]KAE8684956.1 hypothetical protein F3Y22_tig00111105pilonHSYRG00804 [Hibiscus syriacus]
MEMGDQNGLPELRRSLSTTTHSPATLPQPSVPFLAHINMAPLTPYHHEPFMLNSGMAMPSGLLRFGHDHLSSGSASGPCATLYGVEMGNTNINGGNSRWPRQETLTLLEIRIRLDSKFKEANQKGPLWDEVSRIMAEEYGYQRSGKKCREKFENLYKYYKKTKQRKAGRQDGKNYRFFRQLELLYGETRNQSSANFSQRTHLCQFSNNTMNQGNCQQYCSLQEEKPSGSLSFSDASEIETSSSSENNGHDGDVSAIDKKGWKTKVKELVESQMKKLMDSQDFLLERMLKAIEDKEQERISKEEEWRREEAALFDKEHKFWVKERGWVEARDAAFMEVLEKFTGKGLQVEPRFQENTAPWYYNPMGRN